MTYNKLFTALKLGQKVEIDCYADGFVPVIGEVTRVLNTCVEITSTYGKNRYSMMTGTELSLDKTPRFITVDYETMAVKAV